jgi:hypothetical protein
MCAAPAPTVRCTHPLSVLMYSQRLHSGWYCGSCNSHEGLLPPAPEDWDQTTRLLRILDGAMKDHLCLRWAEEHDWFELMPVAMKAIERTVQRGWTKNLTAREEEEGVYALVADLFNYYRLRVKIADMAQVSVSDDFG